MAILTEGGLPPETSGCDYEITTLNYREPESQARLEETVGGIVRALRSLLFDRSQRSAPNGSVGKSS